MRGHARGNDVGIYEREAGQAQPRPIRAGSRATKRLVVLVVVIVLLLLCLVIHEHGEERHPLHHHHHMGSAVVRPLLVQFHCQILLLFCNRLSCLTDRPRSCLPVDKNANRDWRSYDLLGTQYLPNEVGRQAGGLLGCSTQPSTTYTGHRNSQQACCTTVGIAEARFI